MIKAIVAAAAIPVFGFLTELPLLLFGWASFIARNLRQVTVHPAGLITGAIIVGLLIAVIHGFGSSYCRAASVKTGIVRRWRFRRTLAILGIVVVMFVVSLSTIGLARHLGWMFSSSDPTYQETVKYNVEF